MKKLMAMVLAAVLAFTLCSCSVKMTAAENYLIALKKMDAEGMKAAVDAEELLDILNRASDEEREALKKLYAPIQYTVGEQTEEDGARFVSLTLKVPDMARLIELVKKQILVSAETAEKVISDMIDDGTVAKTMMIEKTVSVKMIEKNGEWVIAVADEANDAFMQTIALTETVSFVAGN
ncbi:MAG: hypothetical protein IJ489_05060 [Clostridia bacterium]|nr:hypothetical protein [Clostridia bacterium]